MACRRVGGGDVVGQGRRGKPSSDGASLNVTDTAIAHTAHTPTRPHADTPIRRHVSADADTLLWYRSGDLAAHFHHFLTQQAHQSRIIAWFPAASTKVDGAGGDRNRAAGL